MPTITGTTQYWLEYQNTSYGGTAGTHTPKFTYSTSETDTTFTVSLSSIQATIKLTSCMAQEVGKTYTYKMIDKATVAATGKSSLSYTHTKSYGSNPQLPITHTATFANSASFTWNKASSPQSITVSLSIHCDNTNDGNQAAVASVSLTVPALQSWPVTYYSNNGTSASQVQNKYYGVALTLAPTDPIFDGYTLKGWATSTADAAAGTVTWEKGDTYSTNAALDLYAVWELSYSKPTITNLSVERCLANGDANDEGEYARVKFDWSIFKTDTARYYGGSTYPYSSNAVDICTITVGTETATPTLSGASGSEAVTVGSGSFSVDTEYSASVAITDTQTIVSPHTTTVNGALPTSSFPMDVNASGTAVALLRPAPDDDAGVFIGDDLDVDGDVTAAGDITDGTGNVLSDKIGEDANGDISITRNITAGGYVMAQGMAGMIQMFAGSTAPTGWLMCDGSAVSRTTYSTLFSVIGTTYGTGDGSTTFNLPDLRGRMPLGSSSSHSLASTGGSEYIQAHTHSNTIKAKTPKFTHSISSSNSNVNLLGGGSEQSYGKAGSGGSTYPYKRLSIADHAATDCTMSGSVGAVSGATTGNEGNMPPFLTINYIIATGKTA